MKKYVIINGKKLYIANVVFVLRYEKRQEVTFEGGGWSVVDDAEIMTEE